MDFAFSDEQKMIQQMARDFAEKDVAPMASLLDQKAQFPSQHVAKMAELGLMGMMVPPEWGGSGLDTVSYVLALEEISAACASTGVTMSVNNSLYCAPVQKFGTEAQKERFLKAYALGQKLGCYGLSEPGTGSDAAHQQTTAKKDGDSYILNGCKNFITNGPHADAALLFAMTDKEKGNKGISAFLVERETPGYSIGKIEKKLGICASSTSEIVLEDCRIPKGHLLGEEGQGFKVAMWTLDGGRIGIATQAVGIARASLEAAIRYSKEREAFGQAICHFQTIQNYLAEMATRVDAARLLTYQAAWNKDNNLSYSKEAAMAKNFASEAAVWCADRCVQIFGGYGYVKEYPAERYYRDAKITEIYEGTSEIQKMVIARSLLRDC